MSIDLGSLFVAGTPASSPSLHVTPDGWCQVTGAWQMAASGGRPAVSYGANTTIASVPSAYAPAGTVAASATPFGAAALITGGCRIFSTGAIEVYVNNTHSGGTTTAHFPLTGLRWRLP